jgi:hypothetical protein
VVRLVVDGVEVDVDGEYGMEEMMRGSVHAETMEKMLRVFDGEEL